jgi:hypothetical protein
VTLSQGLTLSFAIPSSHAAGANTSPSTTAIGRRVSQSSLSATASTTAPVTYNYQQVTAGTQFSGSADAFVTFGVAFQTMQPGDRSPSIAGVNFDSRPIDLPNSVPGLTDTLTLPRDVIFALQLRMKPPPPDRVASASPEPPGRH